nr:hypothetical protein [Tanacetum cinerariifolium]
YEIERLAALLHSRTTTSDVGEGDQANISNDSHALEEDVASPAELTKANMGASTRLAKVSPSILRHGIQAPRQDSVLLNNTSILPRTPVTSHAPRATCSLKGVQSGITTPRSHGISELEGSNGNKMGGKRKSSILDDLGSGGLMRRI